MKLKDLLLIVSEFEIISISKIKNCSNEEVIELKNLIKN